MMAGRETGKNGGDGNEVLGSDLSGLTNAKLYSADEGSFVSQSNDAAGGGGSGNSFSVTSTDFAGMPTLDLGDLGAAPELQIAYSQSDQLGSSDFDATGVDASEIASEGDFGFAAPSVEQSGGAGGSAATSNFAMASEAASGDPVFGQDPLRS